MNLTINVDADVLEQARLRALQENTSVNAVLREYLEHYAGVNKARQAAIDHLLELSRQATSRRGGGQWNRDELHER